MDPWKRNAPDLPPAALAALRAGRKIEAIKIVRTQTGADLTTAKAMVDAAERGVAGSGAPRKSGTFGRASGREDRGTLRLVLVLALLGGLGAAILYLF